MESITSQSTLLLQNTSTTVTSSPITASPETLATTSKNNKQLQPDEVVLSAEAKAKSAQAEEKEAEDKKNIDASNLNGVMSPEEAAAAEKANESDLDKRIRELSMEILELSVKIQMLQDKEDKESVKERRNLEVDLTMKKGELEAAMDRKLQMAAVS